MGNKKYRSEVEKNVKMSGDVPIYLLSSVKIFRSAFPLGIKIDSDDYFALWSFLEKEDFTNRAIATLMDYAFDLDYIKVLNSYGGIPISQKRETEIKRIEKILEKFELETWRKED